MRSNHSQSLGVPDALKNHVEGILLNHFNTADETTINVFSNGTPGIVFHNHEGHPAIKSIKTHFGRTFSPPTLFLHGPGTESSVMYFGKGSYTVIQVLLKPHALRGLFGLNALRMKDEAVELNQFSTEDLNDQLLHAGGDQEQISLLTTFLFAQLRNSKTRDNLIEESLRLIHRTTGTVTVKTLRDFLAISERQLERRFGQTVGLSPLSYIRIRRFNEAIRLMRTGKFETLTEIAYALKFHDQSHFIRELKAFTGITPKSLSHKAHDFFHNQAGYSY